MPEEIDTSKLELIDALDNLSLYYDREDASIYVYDGTKYHGADMNVLAEFLIHG